MNRFLIAIALLGSSMLAGAQTLDDVNKLLENKKFAEAREAMDKHIAVPKNSANSDAWYFKGRVYNAYSYEQSLPIVEKLNLKSQAFDAFKKNQEMDKAELRLKLENHASFLDLYAGLYDVGAAAFNAKDFETAFTAFQRSLEVEKYIISKNYTYTDVKFSNLDTGLVLNIAISAMQAKKDAETVKYYTLLTDANVSGSQYMEVYEYLADYYSKAGETAKLQAILDKGKTIYPTNEFWTDLEMAAVREEVKKSGNNAALFAKYEELIAKNPGSFLLPYNYSIDLFNATYVGENRKDDDASKAKLTSVIKSAIANDKGIDATILMTRHLYAVSSDLSIAVNLIKGTKPEDVKKKADLSAKTKASMNEFLSYGDKVIAYYDANPPKANEKAKYREMLGYMSETYTYLKNTAKAAEMEKKKASV
jgi:tetratricopeptide (TPR) repeat protein